MPKGPPKKFTDDEIIEFKKDFKDGMPINEMRKKYNCGSKLIVNICGRRSGHGINKGGRPKGSKNKNVKKSNSNECLPKKKKKERIRTWKQENPRRRKVQSPTQVLFDIQNGESPLSICKKYDISAYWLGKVLCQADEELNQITEHK